MGRIFILFCFLFMVPGIHGFTTTDANNIHTAVLTNYNNLVRPSSTVQVKIEYSLLSINGLNLRDQTLSTSGWFTVIWTDSRLTWTPASHNNIEYIYLSPARIWKPELVVDNTVQEIAIMGDDDLLFRVKYDGEVKWDPPGVYVTHCEIDTTWYPFDKQRCNIEITSWAYTKDFLELTHHVTSVNMEDYNQNGEWTIVKSELATSELTENGEKFSQLEFIVEIKRRPNYYVANVIFPVVLTAILTTVTFLLPADSGEKISYILTILLALAVLLTLIADNMPTTAIKTSVLGVYLSVTLSYAAVAIILTVLTLRLQVMPEGSEVPNWLQKFTRSVLLRCSCFMSNKKITDMKNSNSKDEKKETNLKKAKKAALMRKSSAAVNPAWDDVGDDVDAGNFEETAESFSYDNKDIAEMIDRFFFVVFAVLETLTTVVFMATLAIGSAVV